MSKMFPFITDTWNPLAGECPHNCSYCWAKKLIKQKPVLAAKYQGQYSIDKNQINKKFKDGSFVFVCDMLDLFAKNVPMEAIQVIMHKIAEQPKVTFLILTKNPGYAWLMEIPQNVVIGATVESNLSWMVSTAPNQQQRLEWMQKITENRKMLSIEPVMEFDLELFAREIINVQPEFVAIGYDNYKNVLTEPSFSKVLHLITMLEAAGITVYKKTLRDAINRNKQSRDENK